MKIAIKWDTDGERVDLPETLEISADIAKKLKQEEKNGHDTAIADYLSDKYGWCVNSILILEE